MTYIEEKKASKKWSMAHRLRIETEADLQAMLKRPGVRGINGQSRPAVVSAVPKRHKYGAKRVEVDGIVFPSLLEARWYTALQWQAKGNLITEPLRQVRFSLGEHYGRERVYIADFCFVNLHTGQLIVAEAKGHATEEYKRKKRTFEQLYGMSILELKRQ